MPFYEAGSPDSDRKHKYSGEKKSAGRIVWEYVRLFLIALAVALFLQNFIIVNATIPSESMENTIMTGDRIIGNRLAYKFGDPKRYDIIIFKYPDNEKQLFIKRLIGLPGETVVISDGKVYIISPDTVTTNTSDDALMEDPYMLGDCILLDDSFCPETPIGGGSYDGVFRVPEEGYFMLGDNRNHSKDSRFWTNKYVTRKQILGKAVFRYWPLNQMKTLSYKGEQS